MAQLILKAWWLLIGAFGLWWALWLSNAALPDPAKRPPCGAVLDPSCSHRRCRVRVRSPATLRAPGPLRREVLI